MAEANYYNTAGHPLLPLGDLVHRGVYRLAARNLDAGVWDAEREAFLGLKEPHMEYEYEWDTGGSTGTANAYALIEMLPEAIEFRYREPSVCALHGRLVYFKKRVPEKPTGDWYHQDDDTMLVFRYDDPTLADGPVGRSYEPMYAYFRDLAARLK